MGNEKKPWFKRKPYTTEEESSKAYEANYVGRLSALPDFDTMKERFQGCDTLHEIASDIGRTYQRVQQIFYVYFSKIIPRRPSGVVRRQVCLRKKRVVAATDSLLSDPDLAALLKKVSELGIEAKPIRRKQISNIKHLKKRLLLNNRSCRLVICNKTWRQMGREYWHFAVRNAHEFDFQILQVNSVSGPQFLVVPSEVMGGKSQTIYVPADLKWSDYFKGNKKIKIDWLQYVEAWHLLKPKTAETAIPVEGSSPSV
ncbi:MAG: hypothetical protein Q7R67_01685 [bacterium]|nr:hypothetical protein [bacterium]